MQTFQVTVMSKLVFEMTSSENEHRNVESMGPTIYRIGRIGHLYRYNGTYSGGAGEWGVEECEGWGEMCWKLACNACVCDW